MRTHADALGAIVFLGALSIFGAPALRAARANPLPTSAEHVVLPGRSVASEDTSQAIVYNPANLAWLPAPEFRWTWIQCPDDAVKVGCGHAWEVATPLFL